MTPSAAVLLGRQLGALLEQLFAALDSVDRLGRKLAHTPDDAPEGDAITLQFHLACNNLHSLELQSELLESSYV
jgi:hypothetical protein